MNEENHSVEEDLFVRHLAGEATAAEEKSLQEWIAMSKENAELFREFKKTFELSGSLYDPGSSSKLDIDVSKEWGRFEKNIEEREKSISFTPDKSGSNIWIRIAAAILLVVTSGIVINYFTSQGGDQVYQTAENTETVILPDGSTVFLNRHSKLTINKDFSGDNRALRLEGEGFFDVVSNRESPFVIQMEEAEVTVLGTEFNVQGYSSNAQISVTVESGVVRFKPKSIAEEVELRAGEKGVFDKIQKTLANNPNDDVNYLAWKTRKIIFRETRLSEVAEVLKSAYGVDLIVGANVSAACVVTVAFDNQSLEAVLNVLKSTLDLTYKINGNQIEITKAGC